MRGKCKSKIMQINGKKEERLGRREEKASAALPPRVLSIYCDSTTNKTVAWEQAIHDESYV